MFQELSGILLPTLNSALKVYVRRWYFVLFKKQNHKETIFPREGSWWQGLEASKLPKHLLHSLTTAVCSAHPASLRANRGLSSHFVWFVMFAAAVL